MTDKAAEEEKQKALNSVKLKDINLDDKVIKEIVKKRKKSACPLWFQSGKARRRWSES